MFRNQLKIAVRNLLTYRGFTLINTSGLAAGLASFILIMLYVADELSYDRFHEKSGQIYRIGLNARLGNEEFIGANTPGPLVPTLVNDFPDIIVSGTRFESDGEKLVTWFPPANRSGPVRFVENELYYADSSFFELFSIPLLQGDPARQLREPRTLVLTESAARKYFGNDDALGQTLRINNTDDYLVTGICSNVPHNSHMKFDFLASYSTIDSGWRTNWGNNAINSYILVAPATTPADIDNILREIVEKHFGPIIQAIMGTSLEEFYDSGSRYGYFAENLSDLYLRSATQDDGESKQTNIVYVYILSVIAVLILLIACINFMNLSTARSAIRAKETGVRKVLGSQRWNLVMQFLSESVLMSLLALGLAIILVELSIPLFNHISGKDLSMAFISNWKRIPLLLLLGLVAGLIAGSYSAAYLSSFRVLDVLKGQVRSGRKSLRFRSLLVIFQFAISVFLIISTLSIHSQLRYIHNKDLGFDKEAMLVIERTSALGERYRTFIGETRRLPGVRNASASVTIPGQGLDGNGITVEGVPDKIHILSRLPADENFLSTYRLNLSEGRYFDAWQEGDSMAIVINQSTIPSFGLPSPATGINLVEPTGQEEQPVYRPVIGVIHNIHFQSVHNAIRPMGIEYIGNRLPHYITLRIETTDMSKTVKSVENLWNRFMPEQPVRYFFLDQKLEEQYQTERKMVTVFTAFSVLAIFIACIGLLGLASFGAEQRTKEIGIRKAHGANVPEIILLLSRDFSRWVIFGNLLAWPFAWLFINNWLDNFAYTTDINPWFFLLSAGLSVLIAWTTILFYSARSAMKNPVDSLRYE